MISSGVLCTISVFVSNLCCLALSSFFSSILPSKRNLLTQLNTVLVFVLTAMVNVMVRWNKTYSDSKSSFEKSQNPLQDVIFPVWHQPDLGHMPTLNSSGNDSSADFVLAFVAFARSSCRTQPHKDVPDLQGEQKARKEFT